MTNQAEIVAAVKAGDQVWQETTQRERIVVAFDDQTKEVAFDDGTWVPACTLMIQRACSFEDHRAVLTKYSRAHGRVGIMSRRELATLWSDGKLAARPT